MNFYKTRNVLNFSLLITLCFSILCDNKSFFSVRHSLKKKKSRPENGGQVEMKKKKETGINDSCNETNEVLEPKNGHSINANFSAEKETKCCYSNSSDEDQIKFGRKDTAEFHKALCKQ